MKHKLNPELKTLLEFFQQQRQHLPDSHTHEKGLLDNIEFFSIRKLQQHLNNPLLAPAWVHLVSNGQSVPLEKSCFFKTVQHNQLGFMNKEVLNQEIQNGAAVVLEGVDILEPEINEFVSKVEETLPCSLSNCVAFFSQRNKEAYSAHCDSDDVLVIQLAGEKQWQIFQPQQRRYAETTDLTPNQLGPVVTEITMQAGDAMYLRAGVPHKVKTNGSHSLHLAFDLIDSTPSVEQITHEANKLYDYACEDPFAAPTDVMQRYIGILESNDFQESLKTATHSVKEDAKSFRHCIGRSACVNALTKYL